MTDQYLQRPDNGAGFRFQAATGYQAAWLEGRSYWSLVHPADVQGLRGAVTRRKRKYTYLEINLTEN